MVGSLLECLAIGIGYLVLGIHRFSDCGRSIQYPISGILLISQEGAGHAVAATPALA